MELFFDSKKGTQQTEQAEVYKKLKDTFKENLELNTLNEICIINKQWYKKWKSNLPAKFTSVTSITYFNTPIQTNIEEITNTKLGSTVQLKQSFNSYHDIFTGPNYFFIDNREAHEINKEIFIIDEAMKFNIKIISKEMWNYFYGAYGGGPRIHRYVCKETLKNTTNNKKKLLLFNYVFYKKIPFYILIKNQQGKFEYNLFNKQENYLYLSNNVSVIQIKEFFMNTILECFAIERFKLWRLEEEKRTIFVNWIKGKAALFNNNQQTHFSGELIDSKDIHPRLTEMNEGDFFIIEICAEADEVSQQFFALKEKKHYLLNQKCNYCQKKLTLNYTCQCKSSWSCSIECFNQYCSISKHRCTIESNSKEVYSLNEKSLKGLVGIKNLGNTCYMNAAIQCLSNINEISFFFLSKLIKSKGEIFKHFSSTLSKLHYGSDKTISIHNLRNAIGKIFPMFLGNTQEDSEEFLMAIINTLHDEINKSKKPSSTNVNNQQFTAEYQQQNNGYKELVSYINANNSIITNLFVGEFRSSVQCFKCKNISHNFDIFQCLSLPIPVKNEIPVEIYFVYFDIYKGITKLPITIESEMLVIDMRNMISNMLNINPMSFIIASFTYVSIEMIYHNLTPLGDIFLAEHSNNSIVACFQFDPISFSVTDNKYYRNDKLHDSFNNSTIDTECSYKKIYIADLNTEPHETYYTQIDPSCIEVYSARDFCIQNQELNRVILNISNTIAHTINTDKTLKFQAQQILMNTMASTLLVYTDENYGFNSNYLKTFVKLKVYCDNNKKYPFRRKEIGFQRIIYINIKWSLIYLQKYIYDNFTIDNSAPEIRIVNPNKNKLNYPCNICNDLNCVSCLLSDIKGIATIENLLNLYPSNNKKTIDNSYLYYDLLCRKLTIARTDFELELCYNYKDQETVSKTFNQLKQYSSKTDTGLGKQNNSKAEINIYDCLKRFSQKEILDEAWLCSKCNCAQKALKKIQINYSPNILIIQLKRFKIGGNVKIENFVEFAIEDFLLKNKNRHEHYDLCGIINHTGTLAFGHYIACCKNNYNGKWYRFDDANITEIENEKELITNSAYVLFYKKRSFNWEKAKSLYQLDKSGIQQINEAFSQYMINYITKKQENEAKL